METISIGISILTAGATLVALAVVVVLLVRRR